MSGLGTEVLRPCSSPPQSIGVPSCRVAPSHRGKGPESQVVVGARRDPGWIGRSPGGCGARRRRRRQGRGRCRRSTGPRRRGGDGRGGRTPWFCPVLPVWGPSPFLRQPPTLLARHRSQTPEPHGRRTTGEGQGTGSRIKPTSDEDSSLVVSSTPVRTRVRTGQGRRSRGGNPLRIDPRVEVSRSEK